MSMAKSYFAALLISVIGFPSLASQVPTRRTPTPQQRKESLRHRLLRVTGIADNPSTLKGPEQGASGQVWLVDLVDLVSLRSRALTAEGGYRSPIFMARNTVLALKGSDIVRLRLSGGSPERL